MDGSIDRPRMWANAPYAVKAGPSLYYYSNSVGERESHRNNSNPRGVRGVRRGEAMRSMKSPAASLPRSFVSARTQPKREEEKEGRDRRRRGPAASN